jgi:methionine synthase II (cobalamin-independent)
MYVSLSIYVVVLALLLLVGLVFLIWNLLTKVEKYEEDNLFKEEYIQKLKDLVEGSYNRIKQLDTNGAFEADDEVGYFFNSLKESIVTLNAYFQNYNTAEEDKSDS